MAPKLFVKSPNSPDDRGPDADVLTRTDFVIQWTSVALALVKEAAEFAPVPGLRQAAATALQILSTIQAVKDNKSAFRVLGDEATALIAVIWRSYQTSLSKEIWPPGEFKPVIDELVRTLASINECIKAKLGRGTAIRWAYSMADSTKIDEYHEKLRHAMNKFEVFSHLTVADAMQHVLKGQRQILDQLASKGIVVERTEAQQILELTSPLKIDDHNPTNFRSTSMNGDVTSRPNGEPSTRPAHVESVVFRQESPNKIGNAPENWGDHGTDPNTCLQATAKTGEEIHDTETAVEGANWQSAYQSENSHKLDQKKRRKRKSRAKAANKSRSPNSMPTTESSTPNMEGPVGNMNTSMEGLHMHASMRNTNATLGSRDMSTGNMNVSVGNIYPSVGHHGHPQSPPMFPSPPAHPQLSYPHYNPYFSPLPFQSYIFHPSFGCPPINPMASQPNPHYLPPNMFGPGVYGSGINGVSSGNLSNAGVPLGWVIGDRMIAYAVPQPMALHLSNCHDPSQHTSHNARYAEDHGTIHTFHWPIPPVQNRTRRTPNFPNHQGFLYQG